MTWQIASLVILVAVIAGGFAWYERSRPPSRIVALVAALAALAIAGRVAFAPIPNVLATTDVVLLTGYALGGGPGFVVGALAALVSNFWLGQGPWTPWQMAGWGVVGVGGALLAAATGRRLGRLGLAVACGIAGLAYGALLDLSVMVSYGGEQSLDRYLAIAARGLPFNVAHAAGNVALALVAGPALVRMLTRFRERCGFRWRERVATAAVVALATLGAAVLLAAPVGARDASTAAEAEAAGSASKARAWLVRARNRDGGFGTAPGASSSASMTGWATLGLEAAGRNPLDLGGRRTPIAYLRSRAGDIRTVGDLERTILALAGAGVGVRGFDGRDLVAELRGRRRSNGAFPGQVNPTAFGILALKAAGATGGLDRSVSWLRGAQNGDGGWGFGPSKPSEPDSTGSALQALAAAGGSDGELARGARYLRRVQRSDGGWALAEDGPTNSQSTAWAVQGLLAAGVNPSSVRDNGNGPFDYLAARQASDGHYRYSASSDQTPVWVTGQVLVAIERETLPIAAVPRAPGGLGGGRGGGAGGSATGSSGGGGSGSKAGGRGKKRGGRRSPSKAEWERGSATESEEPGQASFEPASAGDDSGPGTTVLVLGGLGVLALALAAGYGLYRRRVSR